METSFQLLADILSVKKNLFCKALQLLSHIRLNIGLLVSAKQLIIASIRGHTNSETMFRTAEKRRSKNSNEIRNESHSQARDHCRPISEPIMKRCHSMSEISLLSLRLIHVSFGEQPIR